MPAFGSYAPNTTRPTFASTIAPAHCAHGSSVTYSVQSFSRSVCSRESARCTASSSAWAVGSRRVTLSLCARTTTVSPRTTAAPTGTSPLDAALRASSSAAAIPVASRGATGGGRLVPLPAPCSLPLRTRRLGRRPGRDPLEREMVSVFRPVHPHRVAFRVLPFEHGHGERVLEQSLDGPRSEERRVGKECRPRGRRLRESGR